MDEKKYKELNITTLIAFRVQVSTNRSIRFRAISRDELVLQDKERLFSPTIGWTSQFREEIVDLEIRGRMVATKVCLFLKASERLAPESIIKNLNEMYYELQAKKNKDGSPYFRGNADIYMSMVDNLPYMAIDDYSFEWGVRKLRPMRADTLPLPPVTSYLDDSEPFWPMLKTHLKLALATHPLRFVEPDSASETESVKSRAGSSRQVEIEGGSSQQGEVPPGTSRPEKSKPVRIVPVVIPTVHEVPVPLKPGQEQASPPLELFVLGGPTHPLTPSRVTVAADQLNLEEWSDHESDADPEGYRSNLSGDEQKPLPGDSLSVRKAKMQAALEKLDRKERRAETRRKGRKETRVRKEIKARALARRLAESEEKRKGKGPAHSEKRMGFEAAARQLDRPSDKKKRRDSFSSEDELSISTRFGKTPKTPASKSKSTPGGTQGMTPLQEARTIVAGSKTAVNKASRRLFSLSSEQDLEPPRSGRKRGASDDTPSKYQRHSKTSNRLIFPGCNFLFEKPASCVARAAEAKALDTKEQISLIVDHLYYLPETMQAVLRQIRIQDATLQELKRHGNTLDMIHLKVQALVVVQNRGLVTDVNTKIGTFEDQTKIDCMEDLEDFFDKTKDYVKAKANTLKLEASLITYLRQRASVYTKQWQALRDVWLFFLDKEFMATLRWGYKNDNTTEKNPKLSFVPTCVKAWMRKFCRGYLDVQVNEGALAMFPWSRPTEVEVDLGKALTKVAEAKHKADKRAEDEAEENLRELDELMPPGPAEEQAAEAAHAAAVEDADVGAAAGPSSNTRRKQQTPMKLFPREETPEIENPTPLEEIEKPTPLEEIEKPTPLKRCRTPSSDEQPLVMDLTQVEEQQPASQRGSGAESPTPSAAGSTSSRRSTRPRPAKKQ